jgi:hypothetical protein
MAPAARLPARASAVAAIGEALGIIGPKGVQKVADDLRYPLMSRAGNMDPMFRTGEMYALDPVEALASGYADPDEALRVARQADLQILASHHPRGPLPRYFAGVPDRAVPLYVYPGRSYLGQVGDTGLATTELPFGRQAEVAALNRTPSEITETIRHESGHLLDPLLYQSSGPGVLPIRSRKAQEVARQYDPMGWQAQVRYWANESEIRATLSRLRRLMSQDRLVTTPAQAKEMLDASRLAGTSGQLTNDQARAAFTAEGLLRSKYALERAMPWMTGALSVGAMVPAEEE